MSTRRIPELAQLDEVETPDLWDSIVHLAEVDRIRDDAHLLSVEDTYDEIVAIEFDAWNDNDGGHGMTATKWMAAALVAALVALVIGYVVADDDPSRDVATSPDDVSETTTTTTLPESTTSAVVDAGAAAISLADDYFTGLASGDIEGMRATFTDDALILGRVDVETFMLDRIRRKAAGHRFLDRTCEEGSDTFDVPNLPDPGSEQTLVICEGQNEPYAFQLLGIPAETWAARLLVEAGGIARIDFMPLEVPVASSDDVYTRMLRWAQANSAELLTELNTTATTAEQAERQGEVESELVDEWVAYLEANGCSYDEPCPPAG